MDGACGGAAPQHCFASACSLGGEALGRETEPGRAPQARCCNISLADSSSLLYADHSPLCSCHMLVDKALEEAEAELADAIAELSNPVSTSAGKPHNGEWLAFKSELGSAGMSMGPLNGLDTCGAVAVWPEA